MSPRAACRLERLGFAPVYDYALGKVDWMAAGLPTERADSRERRALDAADRTPPTCAPDATVAEVADIVTNGSVLVVDAGVLLGRVRPRNLADAAPATTVEDVMELGPSTVRAHEPLQPLLERMAARNVPEIIVTTPEGRLLGVVHRERNTDD
jgi:CBS domain-containing protein